MRMQIENWFSQDIKKAVKVQYIDGNVFSMDNRGNLVGVALFDGETAVDVSGTISANIIRSDGTTVAATGSSSGNRAWVQLPQNAYEIPGVISIIIKATEGTQVTTLCAVVSNVYQSTTDSVIDPGTIIPSIAELIDEIETAVASIPADYSSLWTSLAPAFSASTPYVAGRYVTYNGAVYRFTVDHSGTWNASDVTAVALGTDLTGITQAFLTEVAAPIETTMTLPSRGSNAYSGYYLFGGETYQLQLINNDTQNLTVNLFARYNSSNYVKLHSGETATITPDTTGQLTAFSSTTDGYTGEFTVRIIPATMRRSISSTFSTISTVTDLELATKGTKSLDDLGKNTIYMIGALTLGETNLPDGFSPAGTVMTYSHTPSGSSGLVQEYTDKFGRRAIRYKYNSTIGWNAWDILDDTVYIRADFTSELSSITSDFQMEAGKKYYIKSDIPSSVLDMRYFNTYINGHSELFARVFNSWVEFTPEYTGTVRIANTTGYSGTVNITIMPSNERNDAIYYTPRRYAVDVTGAKSSYTSLTDLLLSFVHGYNPTAENVSTNLWLDTSPKEIVIYQGTYNIFNEYLAEISKGSDSRLHPMSDIPDDVATTMWFGRYNAFVPPNTKIIGKGNVVLQFTPTTSQINVGASLTWSPMNIFASCHIENIKIVCKNCRYGIHDDPGSGRFQNEHHVFRDVTVDYTEGDSGYGRSNTIGFGFSNGSMYEFDECELIYRGDDAHGVFYGHDSGQGLATIVLNNCIVRSTKSNETKSFRVQTINSTTSNPGRSVVKLNNCVLLNGIYYDYSSEYINAFDITLIRSGNPSIVYRAGIDPSTNPFPPRIFE